MGQIASYIKNKRENMGLSYLEFAQILNLNPNGERTVRGWEKGEHKPTPSKLKEIKELKDTAPFKQEKNSSSLFTFIDLFAGIGGIRLPFQKLNGKCVFSSEWDKFAQKTYATNFGELPKGDITKIEAKDIPDHDLLLAGFPCQAFSQAGRREGFFDTRGTMFFEIQRILAEKRPKMFLLENVKQLVGHDRGRTLKVILQILRGEFESSISDDIPLSVDARKALSERLNYWVDFKVIRAADFGAPQNRERIYIVGYNKDHFENLNFDKLFSWPKAPHSPTRLGDILESRATIEKNGDVYTISDELWQGHQRRKEEHQRKGNGFGYTLFNEDSEYTNTISARYYKDGSEILIDQSAIGLNPRKLTPRECARLQGFPENYIVDAVSRTQIYKQFGNSVCVNVVEAIAESMIDTFKKIK